jgi:hypothetical protein
MSDRVDLLLSKADRFTGIDFVRVVDHCDQRVLQIFFVTDPRLLDPLFSTVAIPPASSSHAIEPLTADSFVIHSDDDGVERILLESGAPIDWRVDPGSGRIFVEITLERAGEWAMYRLTIEDPFASASEATRVDPYFNAIAFDFKVGCDDGFDCEEPPRDDCPPLDEPAEDVDMLARDFVSYRGALIDMARRRLPDWHTPLEADPLVMLIEVLAALGDDLAYTQDRCAREAHLETATQRRSLRKIARLVDYEVHDGRLATTDLLLSVTDTDGAGLLTVPSGLTAWALSVTGPRIPFETGGRLVEPAAYVVMEAWNLGAPTPFHWDDDAARVLPCGSRELLIEGPMPHIELWRGRKLLFELPPATPSERIRRHLAEVTEVEERDGSLEQHDPITSKTFHRIVIGTPTPFDIPLDRVRLSVNLVPAIAGETKHHLFRCGARQLGDPAWLVGSVEREGPLGPSVSDDPTAVGPILRLAAKDRADDGDAIVERERPSIHLASLPESDDQGLGFAGESLRETTPEIVLRRVNPSAISSLPAEPGAIPDADLEPGRWRYQTDLLGSSDEDEHYTLEDGTWRRVMGFVVDGVDIIHRDYATGAGYTLRFGDGAFGRAPADDTVFYSRYRTGPGRGANLPPDSIRALALPDAPTSAWPDYVTRVTNPIAVTEGVDPESLDDIRLLVPEAWRAERHFAVRPDDYAEQSQKLEWVQRAHGKMRWTGSWPTMFVSADPAGASRLSTARKLELVDHLDCVRQATREVGVQAPRYLALDLVVRICVEPWAYPAQVRKAVRERLVGPLRSGRPLPFFHPDRFTFGTPVRRAALEGAIHDVRGVQSVLGIDIGARGHDPRHPFEALLYPEDPAADWVVLLDADPRQPHRGTLEIIPKGGA